MNGTNCILYSFYQRQQCVFDEVVYCCCREYPEDDNDNDVVESRYSTGREPSHVSAQGSYQRPERAQPAAGVKVNYNAW